MSFSCALRVFAASAFVTLVSCGSSDAESTEGGIVFRGEGKLLEGFAFNTGPQPSTGPASVSLRLSGGGAVKVEARADVADGKLAPRAGTGLVDIAAFVKLDGTLKIDSPLKKSSGDIPGLKDLDIPIVGTAPFDPFLLEGDSAEVSAAIPETKLPDVPLGSVPGKLRLTIVAGSKLTSKFQATCMTVASGSAQYVGHAVTSGTLVIKGTIVLELPSPLNKEIELPEFTVPIPSATSDVVFAAVATPGAGDEAVGACGGAPDGDGGAADGGAADGGAVDGGAVDGGADSSTADSVVRDGTPSDSVVTDTTVVADTRSDVADTGSDTIATDTSTCADPTEPDGTQASAQSLVGIDDCDGSGFTTTGTLRAREDVDVLRYTGSDTFGCAVNPYAKVTGAGANVCLAVTCKAGTTDFQGCVKGVQVGTSCCGTEVQVDFGCSGSTNDSADVYMTVSGTTSTATCSSYSLALHY